MQHKYNVTASTMYFNANSEMQNMTIFLVANSGKLLFFKRSQDANDRTHTRTELHKLRITISLVVNLHTTV